MPRPSEQAGTATATIAPEEVKGMVAGLRATFNSEKTMSKEWRVSQLKALDRLLDEGCDELCEGMNKDLHKSMFEGYMQEVAMQRQEIHEVLGHLDEWMAPQRVTTNLFNAPATSEIHSDPLGVVLILGAWNYNVLLTLQPLIGAIAAGNCTVLKPGSYSVNSGKAIAKLIPKYMDAECIRCVEGNRHITNALLAEKFDMMFFTGSPYVGRVVAEAAAKNLTPVVLELGGKSPCIVDETCTDLKVAAHRAGWGGLMNAGQTCVRPDYYMVHEKVADKFVDELKKVIVKFYSKTPKESEWFGRLVNDDAFNRLNKVVEDARGGGFIAHGGDVDAAERYLSPTVLDFGSNLAAFEKSEAMQDELFGPVIPIYRYSKIEDVVQFVKARPKPLALYCFTANKQLADMVLRRTTSGGAIINDVVVHLSNPNLPFGGVGDSGMGSYHGRKTFDVFSHSKSVLRRTTSLDQGARYPPYTSNKQKVMRMAFKPSVDHYYSKVVEAVGDKRNLAMTAMAAVIVGQRIMSRL